MTTNLRRRLRMLACGLAVAVAAGAIACKEGPDASARAPGAAANEYFPMVSGAHWRYKLALEVGSTEIQVVARGDQAVEGLSGVVFVMDEHALDAEQLGIAAVGPTAYVARDGFLCRYTGLDYLAPNRLKMLGEEDPARVMPLGGRAGSEWSNETRLMQQPDNGGGGLIKWTGRTRVLEVLKVPAGEFRDVLVVETEYWDPSLRPDGPLIAYEDFYARGVGLLRSVTNNARDGGIQMAEQMLLDFDFPEAEAQQK
jgi:hypothetical protein